MGDVVKKDPVVMISLPRSLLAIINRILALPGGVHTVQIVKRAKGAGGLIGWAVVEGPKLEQAKK